MTESKVFTVRLPLEDARRVEFIARVAQTSVNDVFRAALASHYAAVRADAAFMARVDEVVAQDAAIAKALV